MAIYRTTSKLCLSCIFAVTLLASHQATAAQETATQDAEIPPVILAGLNAYRSGGAVAAIKEWFIGSALEGEKVDMSQASSFQRVESLYGSYAGFDLIRIVTLTPKTKLIYLEMNFQKGPLFANFHCYRAKSGWVVASLNFHTEVERVIPKEILYIPEHR